LAGIFGCAILTSIVHPASRFAPILSSKVAVWVGERSYAIYLWHWVVFQLTRPRYDIEGLPWALYSLRILIVLALADISLRFVELPIRSGQIQYWLKGMKYRSLSVQRRQKALIVTVIVLFISSISLVGARAISQGDRDVAALKAQLAQQAKDVEVFNYEKNGLWVVGDSVILGIHYELEKVKHISLINARVGRQAPELLDVIKHDKASVPNSIVVFNLGNNNKLSEGQVAEIFAEVSNQPKIVVVNTAVPRAWRDANNELIAQYAQKYSATLVDWAAISNGHPEYFAPDGVHLVPTGVQVYVSSIASQL
jgi:hypothetical protein